VLTEAVTLTRDGSGDLPCSETWFKGADAADYVEREGMCCKPLCSALWGDASCQTRFAFGTTHEPVGRLGRTILRDAGKASSATEQSTTIMAPTPARPELGTQRAK
jgi:hypothetical protein